MTNNDDTLTRADEEESLAALEAIRTIAHDAGYQPSKETTKLAEFISPTGHVLYIEKTRASLNSVTCFVHPNHSRESLIGLDGVRTVSDGHRFHSNMSRFPKRLHRGQTPTAYGWQVNVETLLGLHRFLSSFAGLKN